MVFDVFRVIAILLLPVQIVSVSSEKSIFMYIYE